MNFIKKYHIHITIGGIAGLVNGFLGAGGGIIIAFFLAQILTDEQKKENGVFANAVITMLPISIVSLILYLKKGYIEFDSNLFHIIPSAVIGGFLGAFLLTKLKLKTVKLIFAFLVTLSGFMMLFK